MWALQKRFAEGRHQKKIDLTINKKDDFETRSPVIFGGDIFDEEVFLSLL